jgi:SSS family solute:Na+ symporter
MKDIPEAHFSLVAGVGYPTLVAWLIGNIGAIFSTQYILQCISGLPNPIDAKKAAIVAAIVIFPIGFISSYIGIMAKAIFPNIKSIMALPAFFDLMNPWLVGIVASAMIAATFVTILACQLGATALLMKDFYIPMVKPDKKHEFWATRGMAVVIGLLPIPFALVVPGIIKTLFFARALRTAIAVLVIFMLYLPHIARRRGGFMGLVLSVVVTVVWFLLGDPWGIDNIYIALVIPAIMMLIDYGAKSGKVESKNNKYELQGR